MADLHLVAVTDATFGQEVEQHQGLAVVDFWATWCGPCHMVAPILEQLAGEYQGKLKVAKVDVDAKQKTARRFNVRWTPGLLCLPDECLLLFFRKGEAVNAASLHTAGRQVVTITEALKRMRSEVERGELAYCAAPMEQLAWMYQSCAVPVQARPLDPSNPGTVFP